MPEIVCPGSTESCLCCISACMTFCKQHLFASPFLRVSQVRRPGSPRTAMALRHDHRSPGSDTQSPWPYAWCNQHHLCLGIIHFQFIGCHPHAYQTSCSLHFSYILGELTRLENQVEISVISVH